VTPDAAPEPDVTIVSFGYGHGPAPDAHLTVDVRDHFRDPHFDPALRTLTTEDARVIDAVRRTPGVAELIAAIVDVVRAFRRGPAPGPLRVAIGCVGGRHRSAAIAIEVALRLGEDGVAVSLRHRDMARPVIDRPTPKRPSTGR